MSLLTPLHRTLGALLASVPLLLIPTAPAHADENLVVIQWPIAIMCNGDGTATVQAKVRWKQIPGQFPAQRGLARGTVFSYTVDDGPQQSLPPVDLDHRPNDPVPSEPISSGDAFTVPAGGKLWATGDFGPVVFQTGVFQGGLRTPGGGRIVCASNIAGPEPDMLISTDPADPVPEPLPVPDPAPVPEPLPVPVPDTTLASTPTPTPTPVLTPTPTPTSALTPAPTPTPTLTATAPTSGVLPFTGSATVPLLAGFAILMALGGALLWRTRHRARHTSS